MKTQMEMDIEGACEAARTQAKRYSGYIANEDPEKRVINWFDAHIMGFIEPDEQITRARANVISRSRDLRNAHNIESARKKVLEAIDELERITLERAKKNGMAFIKW
jgi:hypothetical protein